MQSWVPFAMVRVALFFGGGILLAIYQPNLLNGQKALYTFFSLSLAYLISYFLFRTNRSAKVIIGVLGLLAIFVFGYFHLQLNTARTQPNHLLYEAEPVIAYEAIVRSAPESKAKSWKVQVEVIRVRTDQWREATGKVMVYFSKKSFDQIPWLYGDRLLIKGVPNELSPPANPNEFDFKRFLTFKNIYHQQFVQADQVKFLETAQRKGFIYYSHKVRAWASGIIGQNIPGLQEQAITMALVLGVTEGIDTDLQSAYAASGAMHVLAVSGLHVGIIYGIILLLLRPLNSFAWSRWVVAGISILSLWTFAFVTGLSPSVLRAVTMFSFIAFARPLGWRTNIYNTLAASAFVLFFYNPYLIMSVGFQLSYLAVLGIVFLQQPIYNLWTIDSRIGDWVWQITCVSIAAQISTFALSMLYFHQFPVYFLVSNLFVIPLSTGILIGGVFLLIVGGWSFAAEWVGYFLQYLIKLLNWLVFKTEELPFSLVTEIHLTTFQCWLIIGMLMCIIFMIQYRSIQWLYASATVAVIVIFTQAIHYMQMIDRQQFVVYSVSGYSAIEWLDRGMSYFHADSAFTVDAERMRFHIRPNRLQHGITSTETTIPFAKSIQGLQVFSWQGDKIVFVQNKEAQLPQSAEIDYLVVAQNSIEPNEFDFNSVKQVILDGSNSRSYVNKWKQVINDKSKLHSVLEDGAFVLNK